MQFMPANFLAGWDVLATLPANMIEKLFRQAIAAETRTSLSTITATDVLKAMAKAGSEAPPTAAQSAVGVIRLLASDIFNMQISDGGSLRKKLGKQISKLRELGEADEALIEAIGGTLSEEDVAPSEAPLQAIGGCATVLGVADTGIETNLITGKQRVFVTASVADVSGYGTGDASTVVFRSTAAEAITLVRTA